MKRDIHASGLDDADPVRSVRSAPAPTRDSFDYVNMLPEMQAEMRTVLWYDPNLHIHTILTKK